MVPELVFMAETAGALATGTKSPAPATMNAVIAPVTICIFFFKVIILSCTVTQTAFLSAIIDRLVIFIYF